MTQVPARLAATSWRAARYFLRGTLAFLPAVVFLRFAQWRGPVSDDRWLLAFKVALPFAALHLLYAACRRTPANRLVTATNAYLLAGGVMAWAQAYGALQIYAVLRESAVMVFVVLTGVLTTAFSRAGFVGATAGTVQQVRHMSLWLLLAALPALGVSWQFRGNPLLAAVLPLMLLSYLGHRLLACLTPCPLDKENLP